MNKSENNILGKLVEDMQSFKDDVKEDLTSIKTEIGDMKQAMYGDERIGLKGLIQKQKIDDEIQSVYLFVKSKYFIGALMGLSAVIGGLIKLGIL